MIQLELNQIGRAGSDCSAPYEVIIHGKCTVRDFVECVLTRNKEWGYIGIADGSLLGSPRIEYARGVVTVESDLFEKIENYIVVKASASGGWSRMDFLLTIDEAECGGRMTSGKDKREIIVVPKTCKDCIQNTHFWWVCDCPTSDELLDDEGRKENCPINDLEIEVEE